MQDSTRPPTRLEFVETAREAFAFLLDSGFQEVQPPAHRAGNPFEVWFEADNRVVTVRGEGYGTAASVTLEHVDGLELAEIYLVPVEFRPKPWKNTQRKPDQLEQIRVAARRVQEHAVDFLEGDLARFRALARPLPAHRRPLS